MKSEIYNALAAINRSFDLVAESLTILKDEGVLTVEYIQRQTEIAEEFRAELNCMILNKRHQDETADYDHYGKMRAHTEAKLRAC